MFKKFIAFSLSVGLLFNSPIASASNYVLVQTIKDTDVFNEMYAGAELDTYRIKKGLLEWMDLDTISDDGFGELFAHTGVSKIRSCDTVRIVNISAIRDTLVSCSSGQDFMIPAGTELPIAMSEGTRGPLLEMTGQESEEQMIRYDLTIEETDEEANELIRQYSDNPLFGTSGYIKASDCLIVSE